MFEVPLLWYVMKCNEILTDMNILFWTVNDTGSFTVLTSRKGVILCVLGLDANTKS